MHLFNTMLQQDCLARFWPRPSSYFIRGLQSHYRSPSLPYLRGIRGEVYTRGCWKRKSPSARNILANYTRLRSETQHQQKQERDLGTPAKASSTFQATLLVEASLRALRFSVVSDLVVDPCVSPPLAFSPPILLFLIASSSDTSGDDMTSLPHSGNWRDPREDASPRTGRRTGS